MKFQKSRFQNWFSKRNNNNDNDNNNKNKNNKNNKNENNENNNNDNKNKNRNKKGAKNTSSKFPTGNESQISSVF